MRLGWPNTLRGWALAVVGGVWSLFVGVYIVGFLTALADEAGLFAQPGAKLISLLDFILAAPGYAAVAWPVGLALGASAGFAAGVWLDARLRPKTPTLADKSLPSAAIGSPSHTPPTDAPVALDRRFTDPDHLDHTCNLTIRAERDLEKVVVMGRFALPIHYLTEARWKWSLPERLAALDLLAGEVVEVPYFERPSAKRGRGDSIKALGRDVPLRWENPDQGEIVRIEVTVHADGEVVKDDRFWQFRRAGGAHYTDALSPLGHDFPDDRLTL
jgi:hypothetical protein